MLHMVVFILLVIGGLNWLLTAFNWNVVELIFGNSIVTTIIYVVIGLAAIYEVLTHKGNCRRCAGDSNMSAAPGGDMTHG